MNRDELIHERVNVLRAFRSGCFERRSVFLRTALLFLFGCLLVCGPLGQQFSNAQEASDRLIRHPDLVKTLPGQNKRWALLIGVDRYEDPNISMLKGASNDARGLKSVLINYAGFPENQVIVLSSAEPLERQPTRKNILRRLSNLAGLVPKEGLLLISFAGHGIDRNGQGFLIPSDATFTDDVSLLEETAISVSNVKQRIKDTQVQQVMIFLDACRSYPTGRGDSANPLTKAFTKGLYFDVANREVTAFVVLYATGVGHRAYEYAEKRQGYFTWAITEGLKGGAANERGEITLGALAKYLENTVPKLVAIDYGAKVIQKPFANIEGYRADELVISATSNGRTTYSITIDPGSEVTSGPASSPLVKKRGQKSGMVIFTWGINRSPPGDGKVFYEFAMPFTTTLEKAGLTVISQAPGKVEWSQSVLRSTEPSKTVPERPLGDPSAIAQREQQQIAGVDALVRRGGVPTARSLSAALLIWSSFSLKDLPSYSNMYVSVVTVSLQVIDLEEGKTIAAEEVSEVRGFGNSQEQARNNALREAAFNIPQSFIDKVKDSAW